MTRLAGIHCFVVCLATVGALTPGVAQGPGLRQISLLKASNPHEADHFGEGGSLPAHAGNAVAVSADGSTIAVGAPHESSGARGINGNQNDTSIYSAGAVYVFTRRGDAVTQQAYIKASNPGLSDMLGSTVVLSADGNTLAVSAPWESSKAIGVNGNQDDDSAPQAGAVYVFMRSGTTWSQQAYLKASNTGRVPVGDDVADGDQFGFSLALSGDGNTLAAGAVSEDGANDAQAQAGALYVFTRTGNTWAQQAFLKGSNTDAGDLFGYGVALSDDGNTMAVAGYDEDGSGKGVNPPDDNGLAGSGAIYAFSRNGGTWTQTAYLKGSRSQRNDALGYAVAISGDGSTIAAGTGEEGCQNPGINPPGCDVDTYPEFIAAGSAGAVYVWVRNGAAWTEQAFLKASNPNLEDLFGVRLAISGDGNTLAVGAPMEDSRAKGVSMAIDEIQGDNSAHDSGAAYVFARVGATWSQRAYAKSANADAFDEFGCAIAISRDGRTIVAGARMQKGVADGAGAAYVFAN